jgi:hypothetical protein
MNETLMMAGTRNHPSRVIAHANRKNCPGREHWQQA